MERASSRFSKIPVLRLRKGFISPTNFFYKSSYEILTRAFHIFFKGVCRISLWNTVPKLYPNTCTLFKQLNSYMKGLVA